MALTSSIHICFTLIKINNTPKRNIQGLPKITQYYILMTKILKIFVGCFECYQ